MYENLQMFKCGDCGHDTYKIYQEKGNKKRIISVCDKCKTPTEITFTMPEIKLDFGKDATGRMAIYD